METHDRSRVPFVDIVLVETGFGACAVVSVRLVDVTFFGPHPEGCGFVVGEVESCDGDFTGFVVASMNEF